MRSGWDVARLTALRSAQIKMLENEVHHDIWAGYYAIRQQTYVALQRYFRTRYRTLYTTFTRYVVLIRCYGITKARPCTGRTLYKCLRTILNLGKHINFSRSVFSLLVQSIFTFFLFLVLFLGLMTKCSNIRLH